MKRLLIGMVFGFLLHKSLGAAYSYTWWNAEASKECRSARPLNEVFICIDKKIGFVSKVIPYVLIQPVYVFQEWQLTYLN